MSENLTTIENDEEPTSKKLVIVDGVKMELDMRTAKLCQVDVFKIGDAVKVMKTDYSTPEVYVGAIVGFDNFKDNPTITIAYLKVDYNGAVIEFISVNKNSENVQICKASEADLPYSKSDILQKIDRQVELKEQELKDLKQKKKYFIDHFGSCFNFMK